VREGVGLVVFICEFTTEYIRGEVANPAIMWSTPRLVTVELPLLVHPMVNIDILLADGIPRRPLPLGSLLALLLCCSSMGLLPRGR